MPANQKSNTSLASRIKRILLWIHRSLPVISPDAEAIGRPGQKIFLHGHTILIERPAPKKPQS